MRTLIQRIQSPSNPAPSGTMPILMWTLGQFFTQDDSKLWWYDFAFEKLLKLWWRIFDHTPFWSLKFRQKLEVISDLWKRYSPCVPAGLLWLHKSPYLTISQFSTFQTAALGITLRKEANYSELLRKNSVALFWWKRKRSPWARRSNSLPWHWSFTLNILW